MKVKELRDELESLGMPLEKGYQKKEVLVTRLFEARQFAGTRAGRRRGTASPFSPVAPKAGEKEAASMPETPKAARAPKKPKAAPAVKIPAGPAAAAAEASAGAGESFAVRLSYVAVVVAAAATLVAFAGQGGGKPARRSTVFSAADLAAFTGEAEGEPIYLALLGDVFDVTKGAEHYGPEGGYHFFAGRDSSRAYVTGNFTDLVPDVGDLHPKQWRALLEWRAFYETHEDYEHAGVLGGEGADSPFYDSRGAKKQLLLDIEASAAAPPQAAEGDACSSAWSATQGAEVWCDGEGFVPRKVVVSNEGGVEHRKCRCLGEATAAAADLEGVYADCEPAATRCKIS